MEATHNQKHAYLIIAHNNWEQLKLLISLLDDYRNDIYVHIDKKSKSFHAADFVTTRAGLYFIKRRIVNWGGFSQIRSELGLLSASAPNHYRYYHLLSGIDLPLKTQDEIHDFFDGNPKTPNYIDFDLEQIKTKSFMFRVQYYYLWQDKIGRKKGRLVSILRRFEKKSLDLQKMLKVNRKCLLPLYKGANWFSINDDLAQYVLKNIKLIKKQFRYSWCADEIFLQSLAMASPYRDNIVSNNYRAIDWTRGLPYTYRIEDVDELLMSDNLFGRKFELSIDAEAVNKIVSCISEKQVIPEKK